MISGLNDLLIPLETSQKPMFEMLGNLYDDTVYEIDKTLKTYKCRHGSFFILLGTEVRKDILIWMDDYLGTVD